MKTGFLLDLYTFYSISVKKISETHGLP